jgi:hypothetical protein
VTPWKRNPLNRADRLRRCMEELYSTGCWTLNISESPNTAAGSSLSGILMPDSASPSGYFLSPKAARGILRRGEKRLRSGKRRRHLRKLLEAVARQTERT